VVEEVNGAVHLVAGWSFSRTNNVSIASHTVFDLASGTYPPGPFADLGTARNHAYSGVIDGKIYVTGGRAPGHEGNDGNNIASTEVYDPGPMHGACWRTSPPRGAAGRARCSTASST
jgi:hypothetical protein